jgi:hypothetical protein
LFVSEQTTTEQSEVVVLRQDKFAEYCDARGWPSSRYQRAKHIGVMHTTLRRLEHGGNPGPQLIGKILAKLGVPFEAVFDRVKQDA